MQQTSTQQVQQQQQQQQQQSNNSCFRIPWVAEDKGLLLLILNCFFSG